MHKIKFSVFSDLHMDDCWCGDIEARLEAILDRAKKEQVDFIIHCGDLSWDQSKHLDAIKQYNHFEIPTYHCLGNHDMDVLSLQDTVALYEMPHEYYYFDRNGFRFIVLNENYYRHEGVDVAYSLSNCYNFPDCRDYISQEQLRWLESVVMDSPYPMFLFSHATLHPDGQDGIKNEEDILKIFRKAHQNGKRIMMCLSGHTHVDDCRVFEDVCYFTVNSATYHCLPEAHNLFPEEFHRNHNASCMSVLYNDPVHAVVTVCDDGTIEIDGMESSFFCGVTRKMAVGSNYQDEILCTPHVLSRKIKLNMNL